MLLHIHNVRSPLNSFLEILQSLSYVGQRRATEDGMVMMSYKLRKLVMSHLSKWESDYDCKLAVKRNQRQRKSQFHQDSVRHRDSYALSTARGYQDGDIHGHMSLTRSKSHRPFRVSEIDFTHNSRKSITTPGKMESARASNTPHVTRDSNYQEMHHIDSDHFLREFLLKSGRLIKRELNVIAMKILRPHWVAHVVTMRVKNALLMLLDRVASARLWSDVESQQLKHLHNAHRAVASTDARTGTDKNSGSKSTLGEARAIPLLREGAISSSPLREIDSIFEGLIHTLDLASSSEGVIDSNKTKGSTSRRIRTIMSDALSLPSEMDTAEKLNLDYTSSNFMTQGSNIRGIAKTDARTISNLAISLQHVAIESVRNPRDATDNYVEVIALALAMRTRMMPKVFALLLEIFPLESGGLGLAGSNVIGSSRLNEERASTGSILMNEGHTSSSSDSDSLSDEEMPTSTQRNPFTGENKGGQGTANTPTVNLTSQEHLDNAFRLLGGRVAGAEAGSPSSGRDHRSQRLSLEPKKR